MGEPRCTCNPHRLTFEYFEDFLIIFSAVLKSIPNLFSFFPVVVFICVFASISGLIRKATCALLSSSPANLLICSSSDIDSTLNIKTLFSRAYFISLSVFPTPANTIFDGLPPALMARNNSPPETTSKPDPSCARHLQIDRLELDLTEKQISVSTSLNAVFNSLYRARIAFLL